MEITELLKIKAPKYVNRMERVWKDATKNDFRNENLTTVNLMLFRAKMKEQVSANTARTYLAYVSSCINTLRADGEVQNLPADWMKATRVKAEQVAMCFLTEDEIKRLEGFSPSNDYERRVKAQFLVECYTGARSSDVIRLDASNINSEGNIVYVSRKTTIRAILPCKPIVRTILESGDNKENPATTIPLKTKNDIIRRMLRTVGITDFVKVYKGGEELSGEKWEFCSTHTGRRSFASNLYLRGVDLYDISRLMGHSSVTMTENYICCGLRQLSQKALEYFK